MNQLAARATELELAAEVQRVALAVRLDAARQKSTLAWLAPLLVSVLGSAVRTRRGWQFGVLWAVARVLITRRKSSRRTP